MRKLAFLLLSVLLLAPLSACRDRAPVLYRDTSYGYFDTVSILSGYETDEDRFREAAAGVWSIFAHYHRLSDRYQNYEGLNNLKTLNDAAGLLPVKLEDDLLDLLEYAVETYELTLGEVNVAMGNVLALWHDARENAAADPDSAAIPDEGALEAASLHTDITCLVIDRENGTALLSDPLMSLDLGALAKGYATEQAARWLSENGYEHYAINAGGNIRAVGTKPNDENWIFGIEDPSGETAYLAKVPVTLGSLVTSGSYLRYFTVDGVRYHHIIDAETLMPLDTFQSVSVLTENSALADALSTALFNLSETEGLALVESLEGIEAFWVRADGTTFASSGFPTAD